MNANKKANPILAALFAIMMGSFSACNQKTTNSAKLTNESSEVIESGQQESPKRTSGKNLLPSGI